MKKKLIVSLLVAITIFGLYSYFTIKAAWETIERHESIDTPPTSDFYEAVASLEFFNSIGFTNYRYLYEYSSYLESGEFKKHFRDIYRDAGRYLMDRIYEETYPYPSLSALPDSSATIIHFLRFADTAFKYSLNILDSVQELYPDTLFIVPRKYHYFVDYLEEHKSVEKLCKEWEEFLLFEREKTRDSSTYNCCKVKVVLEEG